MVSITLTGRVVEVGFGTDPNITDRAAFVVESTDGDSRRLRFLVFASGRQAERAVTFLKPGVRVTLFGKMEARESEKRITIALSAFEVLDGAPADGSKKAPWSL